MLGKLSVENYALIDKLEMTLSPELNIVTGETGAGKSILLGALSLLLGGRADASSIMDREKNCVIEGDFALSGYGLEPFFEENDLEYDAQTVVRRVITPAGKSRAYVNDMPVQLATLKELSSKLIDIHSQHQNLMIAGEAFSTGIVDSVASHPALLSGYGDVYREMKAAQRELAKLREAQLQSNRDEEYVRYQLEELTAANLTEGEQEALEKEMGELSHAEQICASLGMAAQALDDEQTGILPMLKNMENALAKAEEVYPRAGEFRERVHGAMVELKDLYPEISSESERIEADPQRLALVGERLDTIYGLQQKHRVDSLKDLIALRDDYRRRLSAITGMDGEIGELENRLETLRTKASALAERITAGRTKAASQSEKYVSGMLLRLGMPNGQLKVRVEKEAELKASGRDSITLMFSANKNVAPQPLEKVASGGEISRVMLALKSLVAKTMKLPTIIFDEIDTGVSGRIADAMGEIISELSQSMQVINITHLPQVASKGDTHFYVYKDESGRISQTRISLLRDEERIDRIAGMLSGSAVTDAAIAQAKTLLGL